MEVEVGLGKKGAFMVTPWEKVIEALGAAMERDMAEGMQNYETSWSRGELDAHGALPL